MIKADKVCDICGKKRGRPYDHTLCAIKRKAKHAQRGLTFPKGEADAGMLAPTQHKEQS